MCVCACEVFVCTNGQAFMPNTSVPRTFATATPHPPHMGGGADSTATIFKAVGIAAPGVCPLPFRKGEGAKTRRTSSPPPKAGEAMASNNPPSRGMCRCDTTPFQKKGGKDEGSKDQQPPLCNKGVCLG